MLGIATRSRNYKLPRSFVSAARPARRAIASPLRPIVWVWLEELMHDRFERDGEDRPLLVSFVRPSRTDDPSLSRSTRSRNERFSAPTGSAGALLGALTTAVYSATRDWSTTVPPLDLVGALLAALTVGALAGVYPALRAAQLSPLEALRTV